MTSNRWIKMVSAAQASYSYLSTNGNERLTRWRKRWPPRRAWLLWSFRFQLGRRKIQCHFPQRERRSMAHLPETLDVVVVLFTWPEAVSFCTKILFEAANIETEVSPLARAPAQSATRTNRDSILMGVQRCPDTSEMGIPWNQFNVADSK